LATLGDVRTRTDRIARIDHGMFEPLETASGKDGIKNPDYLDPHPVLPSRCEHGVISHDPETGAPIYICQQCAWIRRGGVEKRRLGPPDPVGEPRIIEIEENPNRDWRVS